MTTMAKKETVQRNWYVLDAAGKPLGRTAVTAAKLLRGKRKLRSHPPYLRLHEKESRHAADNHTYN